MRLSLILLALDITLLAAGSIIERLSGVTIYASWPAIVLWGATAIAASAAIVRRKLLRRPALFTLHTAFLLILAGALLTHMTATDEILNLRIGQPQQLTSGGATVELLDFKTEYYESTSTPRNFISTLKVTFPDKNIEPVCGTASLNQVLEAGGYRFFQTGYDSDGNGSAIETVHDPVGRHVTITAYCLLFLSLICVIGKPLLKRNRRSVATAAIIILFSAPVFSTPKTIPKETAEKFGDIAVMHNGRIAPLSTAAREFCIKLTGKASPQGLSSEQVFTGALFYPYYWRTSPVIKRDSETDLLLTLGGNGSLLRIFPVKMPDGRIEWFGPADALPDHLTEKEWQFIRLSPNYLAELIATGKWGAAESMIEKIGDYQRKIAGDAIPTRAMMQAERFYNAGSSSVFPALILLAAALVLLLSKARGVMPLAVDMAGLVWTAALIASNWFAGRQIPMASGFETMQWLAAAAFLLPFFFRPRRPRLIPVAIISGAMALIVAKLSFSSPQITTLQPVLRSPLLSIHVLTIMLAYAMMMLMALCGILTLARRKGYEQLSRELLRPATCLLTAGIFIGAVWADNSWGRYWGWDPKEVWALITMLVYCYPLHLHMSRRKYAVFCVVAFLSVVMTYFGVNYLLGGLHAYNR
ncbi:MAG: cytochrome c biogenesis protein CcsA [Paramuribaculum sp.]|nr:cytochrome c biogenesis protein CcsA [Paramuribaculum sp.]